MRVAGVVAPAPVGCQVAQIFPRCSEHRWRLVPRALEREDLSIDFVHIDGDHSRTGVYCDILNVLDSKPTRNAVMLYDDIANGGVRSGVGDAIRRRHLAFVDLSFSVPSQVSPLTGRGVGRLSTCRLRQPTVAAHARCPTKRGVADHHTAQSSVAGVEPGAVLQARGCLSSASAGTPRPRRTRCAHVVDTN